MDAVCASRITRPRPRGQTRSLRLSATDPSLPSHTPSSQDGSWLDRLDPLELERLLSAEDAALPACVLSAEMVADRNLDEDVFSASDAAASASASGGGVLSAALAALTHVRLDRERLVGLGEGMAPPHGPLGPGAVTHLYLQVGD